MPRRMKKEKLRERNDSLIIVKADGGLVEVDDVRQEFGELHSDKDGITIDIQHKVPVFKPTVLGRPPIQDRMIYYIDAEPQDAGFDPVYMYSTLKSAYNLSVTADTSEAETDRKHKRNMDMAFLLAGVGLLVFAFFIAPLIGFTFKTGGGDDSSEPAQPRIVEPPPPEQSRTATENLEDHYARIQWIDNQAVDDV